MSVDSDGSKERGVKQKQTAVIFDLDGTLADCGWRRHFADRKNWAAFYDGISDDKPNKAVVEVLLGMKQLGHAILFVSGRPDRYLHSTVFWAYEHKIHYDMLYMRKDGDSRDDSIVKLELLHKIQERFEVLFAVDDRDRVVKMWREQGITCFQCAEGDF
jgi:FMN phosphatase YigB (HAD superfamily)